VWDVYPDNGTYYKVEADKRVVGYESDFDAWGNNAFVPSLDFGPVGTEFIFYYHRGFYDGAVYVFAVDESTVEVYDTSGSLIESQTMQVGDYWDLSLSDAVYHVVSSGRIAIESVASNGYSTVPATNGMGVGNRFYFGTSGDFTGAFAVFAYEATDVEVYDLDSGELIYTNPSIKETTGGNPVLAPGGCDSKAAEMPRCGPETPRVVASSTLATTFPLLLVKTGRSTIFTP
jgi:hypothetical protein